MNDWLQSLDAMFEKVWRELESGAENRTPVGFATVSPQGMPEARTVVLRYADAGRGVLEVYTDIQSDKIASLRAHPRAALLHWAAETKLQIRLQTHVRIETGDAVQKRWENVPQHSRAAYGVAPAPGAVIDGPHAYRKLSDRHQFAVLHCEVQSIDAVSLHVPHQRAAARRQPSRSGDWVTNWLAP